MFQFLFSASVAVRNFQSRTKYINLQIIIDQGWWERKNTHDFQVTCLSFSNKKLRAAKVKCKPTVL